MLCVVCGRHNNNKEKREDVSFFQFPKDQKLLNLWIRFCRQKIGGPINTKTGRVCSNHFSPDDIERNLQYEMGFKSKNRRDLKPGAVPSVYKIKKKEAESDRQSRFAVREKKKMITKLLNESITDAVIHEEDGDDDDDDDDDDEENQCIEASVETAADPIDESSCRNCVSLKIEVDAIHLKMNKMKEKSHRLVQSETELQEKIKSLELELEEIKLQNTNYLKKLAILSVERYKKCPRPAVTPKSRWPDIDIDKSIDFYLTHSKVYKEIRKSGCLLPSERTLQRWVKKKKNESLENSEPVEDETREDIISYMIEIERLEDDQIEYIMEEEL